MFVCLFVCLFLCFFVCLFGCLFIYLFVFCFNHRRISKGSFPQNCVKIGLDFAEILRISKLDWEMFICLFVCLFVCLYICYFFALIIVEYPKEVSLKIS